MTPFHMAILPDRRNGGRFAPLGVAECQCRRRNAAEV